MHMREGGDGLLQPSEGLGVFTNRANALAVARLRVARQEDRMLFERF